MWSRRFLIGCGAVFLVGLMLICTFSIGVVTGQHGTVRALSTRASQGTASNFPVPIGGTPNIIGTIQRYGDNTLTLNTAQGSRTITINPQTIVRRENDPAQFSDLRPGVVVAVWGDPGDNGRTLMARAIVIVTQK